MKPTRGVVEGNTYSSEYMGFQLVLPNDWSIGEDENDIGFLEEIPDSFWETSDSGFLELQAVYDRSTIVISIGKLESDQADFSEIDLSNRFDSNNNENMNINFDPNQTPTRIGRYDWYTWDQTLTMPGLSGSFYFLIFQTISNGFAKIITFTSIAPLDKTEVLSFFSEYP